MKVRLERNGIHFYDRTNGTHVLMDEVKPPQQQRSIAPRTVSIAITNECDFRCSYCYVKLANKYLTADEIVDVCLLLDKHGTFDIAFGGGEPTLHPELASICKEIWDKTDMGISITTHGHHLTEDLVDSLRGHVSIIRISIDGLEPYYSKFRHKPLTDLLHRLNYIQESIPIGFNTVINRETLKGLDALLPVGLDYKIKEWLLLPMINNGNFVLTQDDWENLNSWIGRNLDKVPIRISASSTGNLSVPTLFAEENYADYAFIGVNKKFQPDSFHSNGVPFENSEELLEVIGNWRHSQESFCPQQTKQQQK